MPLILASGVTEIVLATAVGVVAIVLAGIALYATLDEHDRKQMMQLVRHPLHAVYGSDDEPDDQRDTP